MRYFFTFLLLFSFSDADDFSLQEMQKEKRVAFIIANGEYEESPIDNAVSDAQKMKAFLQKNNFEIVYVEDASKREIIKGLRDFNSNMQKDSVSLFYFTGHTIQVKEKNYLIPIEASIESDYHVLYEAIELDAIIEKMQMSENRLNIIILDSAQNNPFGDRFRAKKKGLAEIKTDKNTDLIVSAAPNKIVQPYPFTTKLLSILSLKGVSDKEGFQVMQKRFKQPYVKLSDQSFYFNLPDKLVSKEEKVWSETLALGSISAYSAYLAQYPQSRYASIANASLKELKDREEDQTVKQKLLEEQSSKNDVAKKELEALQKEQEEKAKKEAETKALMEAEQKTEEEASVAAALAQEKQLASSNIRFIEPVMALIKAGSFMMGSDDGNEDEKPKHQVRIEKDFYMGRYEVTNVEYKEFLHTREKKSIIPPNWTTDTQPAVAVSWDDATAYAAWLSKLSGKRYRLPTEAEWEYAARAGTSTRYYWGDRDTSQRKDAWRKEYPDNAHDYAWIKTNAQNITQDVGSLQPNAWGLYDIIGNVWEWCSDQYSEGYNTPPEEESLKIIRGGSWFSTPDEITLSHRGSNVNDFTSYSTGFRLVREK